jgi:hypothetical protein
MTFPINGKIKHVPNHQPDKIYGKSSINGRFNGES